MADIPELIERYISLSVADGLQLRSVGLNGGRRFKSQRFTNAMCGGAKGFHPFHEIKSANLRTIGVVPRGKVSG
jgi:hypothetical protein